jgi:tRNA threonylcarbamoyl adenosine modification protein (Sua5/YciO/YrdC/YwlC family)
MYLHIHALNPQPRNISTTIDILQKGGVIIYPTDTIYGLGCDIHQPKAIQRICRIKKIDPSKAQLTFICYDLSDMSKYIKSIPTSTYRMLRHHLPGPYTFILPASREVPKLLKSKKDTVGLRIPDNLIARNIVKELGRPILSASLPGDMVEEYTDPELIYRNFQNVVDLIIDGGIGGMVPSTVIDFTDEEPSLVRMGAGEWETSQ